MDDQINHPKHYTQHPSGVECIDVIEHMTFNIGAAVKYLWRQGLKEGNSSVQDLKKAVWYINREIDRIESENVKTPSVDRVVQVGREWNGMKIQPTSDGGTVLLQQTVESIFKQPPMVKMTLVGRLQEEQCGDTFARLYPECTETTDG